MENKSKERGDRGINVKRERWRRKRRKGKGAKEI